MTSFLFGQALYQGLAFFCLTNYRHNVIILIMAKTKKKAQPKPESQPKTKSRSKTIGRPRKEVSRKEVDDLIAYQATETEICGHLGINKGTLLSRIREWTKDPEICYSAYFGQKSGSGRIKLRKLGFKLAANNAAVCIFLHKVYLGLSEISTLNINNLNEEYKDIPTEDLKAALAAISSKKDDS